MMTVGNDKQSLRRQFPHGALELAANPPEDACDPQTAENNADLFVSQMMLGKEIKKPERLDDIRLRARTSRRVTLSQSAVHAAQLKAARAKLSGDNLSPEQRAAKEAILSILPPLQEEEKPSLRERFPPIYFLGVVLAFLVGFWPVTLLWMLGAACLAPVVLVIALKVPALSARLNTAWDGYVTRHPARAERMRKVADRMALAFDRVLDLLPASLAERLALPDFSQPVTQDARATR